MLHQGFLLQEGGIWDVGANLGLFTHFLPWEGQKNLYLTSGDMAYANFIDLAN